jgi:hypothetical protein
VSIVLGLVNIDVSSSSLCVYCVNVYLTLMFRRLVYVSIVLGLVNIDVSSPSLCVYCVNV